MKKFNISRINTDFGTLRISGSWDAGNIEALSISSIELMGTDGWVLLNQSSDMVIKFTADLTPTLQTHLLVKST